MNKKDKIQGEALAEAYKHDKCTLALSMGVGKTYTGLKYIENYFKKGIKILVAAPKLSTHEEWKSEAVKYKKEHLLDSMDFTTYISLKKQKTDYDIIILDECHNLLYSHSEFLNDNNCKILGLTGTPPRVITSEKFEMVNKYCPVVYEYLTDDAVEDNVLNDYRIKIYKIPLDSRNNLKVNMKSKSFYTSEYKNYNYWTERIISENNRKNLQFLRIKRMSEMKSYPSKLQFTKYLLSKIENKCIIFTNTQAQADEVCKYSYHSKNPNSNDNLENFKKGKIQFLSSVLQLSEGVNIPNLKEGIIMHAYSNNRKLSQRLGRLLRLNVNDEALIHVLCYKGTVDEEWCANAVKEFDKSKIEWIEVKR